MQICILVVIACCLIAFDQVQPSGSSTEFHSLAVLEILGVLLVPIGFARLVVGTVNTDPDDSKNMERRELVVLMAWGFCSLLVCIGLSWPVMVKSMLLPGQAMQMLVLLFPPICSLIAVWWVTSGSRSDDRSSRIGEVSRRVKLQLAMFLLPAFLMFGCVDLVTLFPFQATTEFKLVGLAIFLCGLGLIMPTIATSLLPTKSIAGTQFGAELVRLAKATGTPISDLCIWDTKNRMVNGLIVGMFSWRRKVFLTDRLIRLMDERQIAAVFLHELGHANRHHMLIRLLSAAIPFMTITFFGILAGAPDWVAAFIGMIIGMVCLGLVARRLEVDADLFASNHCINLFGTDEPYVEALEIIRKDNAATDKPSWLHPSVTQRMAAMKALRPQTA